MIRRKPTAIQLTHEDISTYEDMRQREAAEVAERARLEATKGFGSTRNGASGLMGAGSQKQRVEMEDPFWTGGSGSGAGIARRGNEVLNASGEAATVENGAHGGDTRTRAERLGLGIAGVSLGRPQGQDGSRW